MAPYSVTISDNKVSAVEEMSEADYDELGIEWALSELKDTHRHSGRVDAAFSLKDEAELAEFLDAVKRMLGPDSVAGIEPGD
jgi:hypothetical protein